LSLEIAARERAVARADLAFAASLEDASEVGRETVLRAVHVVRPMLIGLGLLAGAALVVRVLRTSPRAHGIRVVKQHSASSELVRSVLLALATAAGRHVAQRLLEHATTRLLSEVNGTP
jgi:hypothetical protein